MLAITLLTTMSGVAQGQSSNENKAKAYYFSAQEYLEAKDYVNALNFLQSAENMLGQSNARIEALRAKTLHQKGDIEGAKRSLDRFFNYSPNASLTKEMAGYARDIEARYESNKSRLAAARRAKAEKDRKARMAADERARAEVRLNAEMQEINTAFLAIKRECRTEARCVQAIAAEREGLRKLGGYKDLEKPSKEYDSLAKAKQLANTRLRMLRKASCDLGFENRDGCRRYAGAIEGEWYVDANRNRYPHALGRKRLRAEIDILNSTSCSKYGDGTARNCELDIVIKHYSLSCDSKNALACTKAGDALNKKVKSGNHPKALDFYKLGCTNDYKVSCHKASEHMKKNGKWTEGAINFAFKACQLGWGDSCYSVAADARRGKNGLNKSKKWAKKYFDMYCTTQKFTKRKCKSEYKKL